MPAEQSHYIIALLAIALGLLFSILRDIARNRPKKAMLTIWRCTGNFILGWGAFWLAREYNFSIEVSGFIAAGVSSSGMNIVATTLYVVLIVIESRANVTIPPNVKQWIDDLSA